MILSFTGCREGMSGHQADEVEKLVVLFEPSIVHHGVCIGSDEDFHKICRKIGGIRIEGHPGVSKQGMCYSRSLVEADLDFKHPEEYYLVRDKKMVETGNILLATPYGKEAIRSGTWTTVRHARNIKRKHIIVYPDGTVEKVRY